MRRNLLIDLGPPISNWKSEIIEAPKSARWKCLNTVGTLIARGPKCQAVTQDEIGKQVLVKSVVNEECRINPDQAQTFGLQPHWYLLCPEDKMDMSWT